MHGHYCYILSLIGDDQVTYVGYTVNMVRRLRQHNGELAGGARFTTRHGPAKGMAWRVVALVTSHDLTHCRGLSLEWHIRYPDGHRKRRNNRRGCSHSGPTQTAHSRCAAGRVCGLVRAMIHGKFTDDIFTAWVAPEYRAVMVQAMVDASHMQHRCHVYDWPPTSLSTTSDMEVEHIESDMDTE